MGHGEVKCQPITGGERGSPGAEPLMEGELGAKPPEAEMVSK